MAHFYLANPYLSSPMNTPNILSWRLLATHQLRKSYMSSTKPSLYLANPVWSKGPQFRSELWKALMTSCRLKHCHITPLWQKANTQAETCNKPMLKLMKAIRRAHLQRRSWKQELYKFGRMYRSTPHCTTQFTPHFLLFSHEAKTKLPEILSFIHPADVHKSDPETPLLN